MSRLFLDLDGVIADFDDGARRMCGTDNTYKFEFVYGQDEFWRCIHRDPEFFLNLNMMPDANLLWDHVKHLNPIILTALPHIGAESVDRQKRMWVDMMLGPEVEVITCLTKDKSNYCKPGDVLVDDRAINRPKWIAAGGQFVVHTSAKQTLDELECLWGMI